MFDGVLVRYGDLTLKGKNQRYFVKAVNALLLEKLAGLGVTFDFHHDRSYLYFDPANYETVRKHLKYVTGVFSFSPIKKTSKDFVEIAEAAIPLIHEVTKQLPTTFKVETKRADKNVPMTSLEISKKVSGMILKSCPYLKVDVNDPQLTFNLEVRLEAAYMYVSQERGIGGYPLPMGGKGLLLLSGGIDSPVAGYLTMKKGVQIECVHYESTPLTPLESAQKVIDLAKVLARYSLHNQIKVHFVPFRDIHEQILLNVPESYNITVMRRMMVRIASILRERREATIIVTGDSIGQVASQTLESIQTIQNAISDVIVRPLATYDKVDIIKIATEIETLDISIRPFSDCCTVYVPKNPSIRPRVDYAEKFENSFAFEDMVKSAADCTKTLTIHMNDDLDITHMGFTMEDVFHETTTDK